MKRRLHRSWLYLPALVLLGAVLVTPFALRSPAPVEPIILLPKPYRMPLQRAFPLERWLPLGASWAWLWHLKEAVFGRRKPVDLRTSIIELAGSSESLVSQLALAHPIYAQTNGLRVWLIPHAELNELRRQLKKDAANNFFNEARMTTADEIAASLFSGETIVVNGFTNQVGLTLEMFPRVHQDSTDLTASILFSQTLTNASLPGTSATSTPGISVRTNLDIGARFQIPESGGIFLVDASREGPDRKGTAVILSAKLPGNKK